jgi:hypothetical protein
MPASQWHKCYTSDVAAPPAVVFELLADLPNYGHWLPGSPQFGRTTDVEPYPVQLGSRYYDGKPDEPGKDWWGTVTGFQPPGSLDFHHTIAVPQLRATVDVYIHYSLEPDNATTRVTRWLVLDISMPAIARPLRRLIVSSFDEENLRTMATVKKYAEAHTGVAPDARSGGREDGEDAAISMADASGTGAPAAGRADIAIPAGSAAHRLRPRPRSGRHRGPTAGAPARNSHQPGPPARPAPAPRHSQARPGDVRPCRDRRARAMP